MPRASQAGIGSGLALQVQRLEVAVLDRGRRQPPGRGADGDRADPARRLQPGRHVDGVADHRVLVSHPAGEHLTGVDAHAQRQLDAARRCPAADLGIDLAHRRLHRKTGPDRPLRVVLVRDRGAEDGHHVVADVLVDVPPAIGHLPAQSPEGAIDQGLRILGIELLGDRRVSGQIREQHGRPASLLAQLRRRRDGRGDGRRLVARYIGRTESGPAPTAESGTRFAGPAATGAGDRLIGTAAHAESRLGRVLSTTFTALQSAHCRQSMRPFAICGDFLGSIRAVCGAGSLSGRLPADDRAALILTG